MARPLTVVNTASAQSTSATTVTTPNKTTVNNSLIVVASSTFAQAPGVGQISDSKGLTWQTGYTENGARGKIGCYYNLPGGTRGATHTFTLTLGVADTLSIGMVEFAGAPGGSIQFDANAHQTVGTGLGFPQELIRSSPTPYTFAQNELLVGVGANSSGIAPFSKEAWIDAISLTTGAFEDILMTWMVVPPGTYGLTNSGGAGACGIMQFDGGTFKVIQSVSAQANATSVTTGAITTTTGSQLMAGCCVFNKTVSGTQITDSKSNSWSSGYFINTGLGGHSGFYYTFSGTRGAGHTFTFTPTAGDFIAIGVFEVTGITAANANSTGGAGVSGNLTTTAAETFLCGLAHSGSGTPTSTNVFNSLWTDDVSLAQTGVGEGLVISHRQVSNYGQYQFAAQTNGNNPEGAGIITFSLPGPTQVAATTGAVQVFEAGTAYAMPAKSVNIEYSTTAAAILEGSLDLTNWVTLDTAPGAGLRTVAGVVAGWVRPSKDITVVLRKTKAKI